MVNIICILLQSKHTQKIYKTKFKVSSLQNFSESFMCQNEFVNFQGEQGSISEYSRLFYFQLIFPETEQTNVC